MTRSTLYPFSELAAKLSKPDVCVSSDIASQPGAAHLLHMAVGVSGESGELLDAIKKYAIYKKPLDRANVIEELADLRFYMAGIMNALGIGDRDLLEALNDKLGQRYSEGVYSNKAAQERKDKE